MRCPACGKTIEDDVTFCAYCGAPVQALSEGVPLNRVLVIGAVALVLLVATGTGLVLVNFVSAKATPAPTTIAYSTAVPPPSATPARPTPLPSATTFPSATPVPSTEPRPTATPIPASPIPATPIVIVITATSTPSPTPMPTATPSLTPTRMFFPIRLSAPANGEAFKDELIAPFLEWRPATDGSLMPEEWYRIQVYHSNDRLQCNLYTKQTFFQLPASGMPPCEPGTWRFNTGDYIWRISFVIKVDEYVSHDKEILNSEGRLFKWNK